MHATLPLLLDTDFPSITRSRLETLQVNLGYRCNQSCLHCHVNAGPHRREEMSSGTMAEVLDFLDASSVKTLDITGGAPELNPNFRALVEAAHARNIRIIDRCNLTIFEEPGQEDLPEFLASHGVEIVASLPCYIEENVVAQRGMGVYAASLRGLVRLNDLGYAQPDSGLVLNLMYNPVGPVLPPPQAGLEADYRRELRARAGVEFNRLYVLANMPVQRFGSMLVSHGQFHDYMSMLRNAYRKENSGSVMCRTLISVDWQGYVYDCDFNQMLKIALGGQRVRIGELIGRDLSGEPIAVADHCYGCTAGEGASCGGILNETR